MKGNYKATAALALLDSTKVETPTKADASKWQKLVHEQLEEVARSERMVPRRAIAIGLMLHIAKASLKRGEFTPWLEQILTRLTFWTKATAKVNASYYMRLSLAFTEQTSPDKAELLALTQAGFTGDLATVKGHAAKLLSRIDKYVGERGLNEMLIEEGIKGGTSPGGGDPAATALAALPADDATLLQDIAEAMLSLRKTVTDPDTLKRLTAAQINQLQRQVDDMQEDFRKARAALSPK